MVEGEEPHAWRADTIEPVVQLIQPLSGHGHADQAASMANHEVYGLWRRLFCGNDQVALILPIFIVQDNDKPARLDLLNRLFYRAEWHNRPEAVLLDT